jgi:diaminopimelate decarboxylase
MEKPRNGSLIYQNGLLSLDDIPDTIVLIDHDLEVDALVSNVIDSEDIHGIVLSHMEKLDLLPPENNESDLIELQKHIEAIEIPSENPSSTTFKPAALQPIQSFVDTLHEAYDLYDQKVKLHMDLLTETFVPYGDDELPNINAVKAQQELQQYCIRFPPTVRYIYEKFKCLPIVEAGPIGLKALAAALIKNNDLDDSFYIYDVSNIQKLFEAWKTAMPRVIPYYAVKCCPMDAIIELLAVNGCGFDCASAGEIEKVLSLGINADRIIFAHPSKRPADIRYAAQNNVNITTFDSVIELQKISKWHPKCNLVLRIRADDPLAEISFGVKFGAMPNEYRKLLERAKSLNLNVLGVSFHVGSLAKSGSAFYEAIKEARKVFVIGKSLGFKFTLLDIGGGFTGRFNSYGVVQSMVGDIPASINKALDEFFGGDSDDFEQVKVIAEPGRYFAESSMHLCCHIHSFRNRIDEFRMGYMEALTLYFMMEQNHEHGFCPIQIFFPTRAQSLK